MLNVQVGGWECPSCKEFYTYTVNTKKCHPPLAFLVAVLSAGCLFMDCANDRKAGGGAVSHEMKPDYKASIQRN